MTQHTSSARPIYQLTALVCHGSNAGDAPIDEVLIGDAVAALTTWTPLDEQVNLLLTTPAASASSLADSYCQQALDSGKLVTVTAASLLDSRQVFRVFAWQPADRLPPPRQPLAMSGDLGGGCCCLHRVATLHLGAQEDGARMRPTMVDDSQWEEEEDPIIASRLPPNHRLRLRLWRPIGAASAVDFSLAVSVAALDADGGFGDGPRMPWPTLSKDVEYFTKNTGTPACWEDSNLRVVNICGRVTFEVTPASIALDERRLHLVIGSRMATVAKGGADANGFIMLPSLQAAVDYARWLADTGLASSTAWIMGGQAVYAGAVAMATCQRIHLTRVFARLPADRFFPMAELAKRFELVSACDVIEEHGLQYRFEVHRRRQIQ